MPVKVGLKYIEIWGESMEDAVLEYEKEPIEKGKIVFYGPSNFTRWSAKYGMKPMADTLLGKSGEKCVINRGFGSTCSEHQLYYYDRMVRPLEPRVLVYYPFGNYRAFGYSLEEAWELAERVIAYAMTDFPGLHIYLVGPHSGKAEPDFTVKQLKKRSASLLKDFCREHENCFYVDVPKYVELNTRKDIFVEDGVHFNQEGYDLYAEVFREALADELAKY